MIEGASRWLPGSLLVLALPCLLACPTPCPEALAQVCAPEEPGEVVLRNPSFEVPGAPLAGWKFVEADGVSAMTGPGVDGCTAISLIAPTTGLPAAARLVSFVDAKQLRGQRVRLSLWARIEAKGKLGPNMVLRARGGSRSYVFELNGTEMKGDHWRLHSVELDVPLATDRLEIQVGLSRIARIDLDGVAIDRIGPACPGCEPPAALAGAQRENLVALTRLLGHVRYFHPSAEVAAADWDTLALVGVQAVLAAGSPEALAAALERVFLPVAPTLRLGVGEGPPAPIVDTTSVLLAWHHKGEQSHRRPLDAIAGLAAAAGAPSPDLQTPMRVELGRGLIAWVPIALPIDAPAATRPPVSLDKPEGFRADGGDRITRLAAIVLLGARVAHFSERLELLERPWEDVLRGSFERVALLRDRYELRDEVFRLFTLLHDGTAQAHVDWDARLMFTLDREWRWIEDRLVITAVDARRTPALRVGDVVEAIDGRGVSDMLAELGPVSFGATAARSRLIGTSLLGRGLAGGSRQVQVRRIDGSEQHVKIPYRHVNLAPRSAALEVITELADGVVYVDLGYASPADLLAAGARLQAARAVVLDARTGLAKGSLAGFRATLGDVGGESTRDLVGPEGRGAFVGAPAIELPERIAVLVDESTTGEVEGLADALRALRGALLVGSASGAAPGGWSRFSLPGGLTLMMTEARHRYVSGQSDLAPLQPDIAVTPTVAGIAAGRDELLERALVALAGL